MPWVVVSRPYLAGFWGCVLKHGRLAVPLAGTSGQVLEAGRSAHYVRVKATVWRPRISRCLEGLLLAFGDPQ